MPPPPGLFSMMMFWPTYFAAISANLRKCWSVEPSGRPRTDQADRLRRKSLRRRFGGAETQ
jgi:hypothetical protein